MNELLIQACDRSSANKKVKKSNIEAEILINIQLEDTESKFHTTQSFLGFCLTKDGKVEHFAANNDVFSQIIE